jgi:hypothetical protein
MSALQRFYDRHPRLVYWAVLAIGMVIILLIFARDVGLNGSQWAALIIATILLAGACVWIIGWEDDDLEEEEPERAAADAESGDA